MYTARDVTLRLRSELNEPRLLVKLDPALGRWLVCVRRKHLTGARAWPVGIRDDGTLGPGQTTIQVVDFLDDIVWVCETETGEYLALEPNLIRQKLIERDTHRRNHARELFAELQRRRAAKKKAWEDDLRARTRYYRRAFARIADDLGIIGKPDHSKLYAPERRLTLA